VTGAPLFQKWDNWTCSIQVRNPSWLNLYLPNYEIVPEHLWKWIVPDNITAAQQGLSTDGIHGVWPGQAALSTNFLAGGATYGITYAHVHNLPEYTMVGTGPWKYRPGSTDATLLTSVGGGCTVDAFSDFWFKLVPGEVNFRANWVTPSTLPSGIYMKIDLADLVMLANAYGKTGAPPSTVPITATPGIPGAWNPAADMAAPSGVVGLSDLVTLALHYGWYFGNYSYNAPYPPAELLNPP
jgi:hypothetical protein